MNIFDVLIVGGGPAGSTMAYSLRNAGLKVAILDKQQFPRQKVCAGWVTPEVMRMLNIDLDAYAEGLTLQNITGFRISQLGQKQVESFYHGEPVSYGIRRIEFDNYLLQRSGAHLLLGEAFDGCERVDDGWIINGKYRARLLVGAGGHFCPVARAIGFKLGTELAVAAQEAEFEMTPEQAKSCSIKQEVPELFFTPDLKGYGWVFRKGNYLNIGLGREDKSKLPGHVKDFCAYLKSVGKIPQESDAKYHGHAYLLYPHADREMIADNVLLIGDSVGLAYAKSGEGIRPAVESAMFAADTVRDLRGDYCLAKLAAYQLDIEQRFGQRLPEPDWMERLPLLVKQIFASNLMKTRWFTKSIVTDRWFLQSHQEPLPAIKS